MGSKANMPKKSYKIKGLNYRKSLMVNTIHLMEKRLMANLSYLTIKDAEVKIAEIERLIQKHFPEDWDKFLIRREVKITQMPDQSQDTENEVEELFAEMAS
jgi:hypothetical protein